MIFFCSVGGNSSAGGTVTLLVQKHTYLPGGGTEESWFLITPSGRVLGQIGDDPQKDQFLARQAAHAPGP